MSPLPASRRLIYEGTGAEAREAADPHVRQFVLGLVDGPL
jgi:hypothetical protein